MTNKRYKDILEQYIYKGESTPFTLGTLVVCALCFILILVATFTQIPIVHPWIKFDTVGGFSVFSKEFLYSPQIPITIFVIYLLGRFYSLLTIIAYLLIGFFLFPIFSFGGGLDYVKTYPFGYFIGIIFAIFVTGYILKFKQTPRTRIVACVFGVFTIHLCSFIYSLILALFKLLDFSMVSILVNAVSGNRIGYDILFSLLIILVAPYIKNFFWICMKPKLEKKKNKPLKRNL